MTNSNHIPRDTRDEALQNVPAEEKASLHKIWDLAATADESPTFDANDVDKTWQALQAFALESDMPPESPPGRLRLLPSRRHWLSLAATLLIGAIGIGWWLQPVTIQVPEGTQQTVHLPDGSSVQLNSGSQLVYKRQFGERREVQLEGEGYFEVAHSTSPFVLTTFNASVEVLGTRFNVKSWPGSIASGTRVTLTEGSVKFSPASSPDNGVLMEPGQTREITSHTGEVSPADTVIHNSAIAWKEGDLVYRDEWLGVVLEDLERKFAVDIELQAQQLSSEGFTFVVHQPENASEVIEGLCGALGLRYSPTARGFTIYEPQ